jgi:hypothetical protein
MKTKTIEPCLGVPVRYDPRSRMISEARGILFWKEIVVGPEFFRFTSREQQALLLHEVGHCKMKHLEKRLARLWLALWNPKRLADYCIAQELEADRFAAACGYRQELIMVFSRMKPEYAPFHPANSDRISHLLSQ